MDKMFPLRPGRLPANAVQNIIFITRPKLSLIELVAQNVLKSVTVTDAFVRIYFTHHLDLLFLYQNVSFFVFKLLIMQIMLQLIVIAKITNLMVQFIRLNF